MMLSLPYPRRITRSTVHWYAQWLTGRYFPDDVSKEHRRILSVAGRGDVVIDAGANIGRITFALALRGAAVHAFEPNPVAFDALRRRFAGWPGITLHNAGVAAYDGTVRLYFHRRHGDEPLVYSTGSSTVADKVNVAKDNYIDVDAIDLARYIRELGRPVTLLKMDIEGAEVQVVPHLIASGAIDNVKLMVVETHEAKTPSLVDATRAMLDQAAAAGLSERIRFDWT